MDEYLVIRADSSRPAPTRGGGSAPALDVDVVEIDEADADDLKRDPDVIDVVAAMPLALFDPLEGSDNPPQALSGDALTWGVEAVGAAESAFDGAGVTVAVLDTGIDPNHPAFAGVDLTIENFTTESVDDTNGHGTHCAGTIFGREVDGLRIGVAPGVEKALIGKVIGAGGTTATLMRSMQWALNNGADVISMSLGFDFPGLAARWQERMPAAFATSRALQAYRQNVDLFSALGTLARAMGSLGNSPLIVAAAGNESRRNQSARFTIDVSPPAVAQGVLAVGAVSLDGDRYRVASFSNTGAQVCNPGVDVLSARSGGGLSSLSGTSMATPHVAGLAALYAQSERAMSGRLTEGALRSRIIGRSTRDKLLDYAAPDHGLGFAIAP